MLTHVAQNTKYRSRRRELERASRDRRAAKLDEARRQCDALERAVVVAHTLGDDNAVWDDFLDADLARVRWYLLRTVQLTKEAKMLMPQNAHYMRLLDEHELATKALAALIYEESVDDWTFNTARWQELVRRHFVPWTRDQCQPVMDEALREVHSFQWSTDKLTTGMTFLGWRDVQRLDRDRSGLQFEFTKTFRGFDIMDYVNVVWDTFTTEPTFADVIIGHRDPMVFEVLQQLGPNLVIFRCDRRLSRVSIDSHVVYLVFRMRTERGFLQCARTICCRELVQAIAEPRDVWPSNFFWFQWDRLDVEGKDYTVRMGGSMGGTDVNYAKQWMLNVFSCVLRSESLATGRQLITSG